MGLTHIFPTSTRTELVRPKLYVCRLKIVRHGTSTSTSVGIGIVGESNDWCVLIGFDVSYK
jgi:hypothetical protein